jgi:hypothetical protein
MVDQSELRGRSEKTLAERNSTPNCPRSRRNGTSVNGQAAGLGPPTGTDLVPENPTLSASERRQRVDDAVFERIPGDLDRGRLVSPDELTETRLQDVIYLQWKGFKQKDLAEAYGVTDRTIRRWLKKAQEHKVSIVINTTADEALGDYLCAMALERMHLLKERGIAGSRAEPDTVLKCTKLLIDLIEKQHRTLERAGLYNQGSPNFGREPTPNRTKRRLKSDENGQES